MPRQILIEARYRSRLEKRIADQLERGGVKFDYESIKIPYRVPERQAKYTPDFIPEDCWPIVLEGKGWFKTAAERQKLIHVRDCNPKLDIRLVFQDANKPIYKGSKTTYAQWATDHDFKWCSKGVIPPEWLEEMRQRQKEGEKHEVQSG